MRMAEQPMTSPCSKSGSDRRIVMAITELDAGGAEKAFVRIACGLHDRGWNVQVVSLRDRGPLAKQLDQSGIPVHALGCGSFADLRGIFRLSRLLRGANADVLLTFLHQANIFGRIAGRRAGISTIVSGIRVADRRRVVAITERLTRCCVDHYVAVSQSVARLHATLCGIPAERMSVILNGVDLPSLYSVPPTSRAALGLRDNERVLLFAGRLSAQKAPMDLLNAFSTLNPELRATCRLLFVGEGPLHVPLEKEIKSLQLHEQVRLLGWRSDVIGIMKIADLLVLPSHWEGLPNVVLEATALGLPVIGSDVDGIRDLLADTCTPPQSANRLFPAGDIQALSQLLEEFMSHSVRRSETPESSQTLFAKAFTWESIVDSYAVLLDNLVRRRNSRGPAES